MTPELKTLSLSQAAEVKTDLLVVLLSARAPEAQSPIGAWVHQAVKAKDLDLSQPGQTLAGYRPPGVSARRLVVVTTADAPPAKWRAALSGALQGAKFSQLAHAAVVLPSGDPVSVEVALMAVFDASYVYTATKPSAKASLIKRCVLGVPQARASQGAFERAHARCLGVALAREWGNRPANHATPTHLAKVATDLARHKRVSCQVLGPKEVAKLGMGSFMAVAQGSEESLKFIVLKYSGAAKSQAPTVLVGKGITFDTGGISLKPGPGMDEMKFDMCGAASVLGTFRSLAELQPAINVVGLIPTCENMPDGRALKPGDVVTSMSGQTIEVLNTDAEGRLILCDALTYAERFKPKAVIDIATLTGACVIALGHVRSGMYATDDNLAQALERAGEAAFDPCWRMPLDDEYAEGLKSNFADVANVADRAAGSVTAAKFLQRFAGQFAWAHLDIAGTAWKSGAAKGATGRPVGLLLNYLLDHAKP
jgi:leucyl aminopeptidase